MAVTEETEAQVRELRAKAEEYGERVRAGEEPWEEADEPDDVNPDNVKNEDVGENESASPETVEVDQENPAPDPVE